MTMADPRLPPGWAPAPEPQGPLPEGWQPAPEPQVAPGETPYHLRQGLNPDIPQWDKVRSAQRAVQAFIRGLTDVKQGIQQAGAHYLSGRPQDIAEVEKNIQESEAEYLRKRGQPEGIDWGRIAGNIVATAPAAALVPGAGAASGWARLGQAVGTGALTGALQPVDTSEGRDYTTEKMKQIGTGAGISGIVGGVTNAITGALSPAQGKAAAQVAKLQEAGVRPTTGQLGGGAVGRIEERAMSLPIVGDAITSARQRAVEQFNRATVEKTLEHIGEKLSPGATLGHEAVREAGDKISAAYQRLLPKVTFQADMPFLNGLQTVASMVKGGALPTDRVRQFEAVLKRHVIDRLNPNTGRMSGEAFKEAESELGRIAANYRGSSVADERTLGSAIQEVQATLRATLARNNPAHAAELEANNTAWASLVRLEDAAKRAGSREGVFSPAQLRAAVLHGDKSIRDRAFARGQAPMQEWAQAGEAVLGGKYPDSGTAGRLMQAGLPWLLYNAGLGIPALAGAAAYTRPGQAIINRAIVPGMQAVAPGVGPAAAAIGNALIQE